MFFLSRKLNLLQLLILFRMYRDMLLYPNLTLDLHVTSCLFVELLQLLEFNNIIKTINPLTNHSDRRQMIRSSAGQYFLSSEMADQWTTIINWLADKPYKYGNLKQLMLSANNHNLYQQGTSRGNLWTNRRCTGDAGMEGQEWCSSDMKNKWWSSWDASDVHL